MALCLLGFAPCALQGGEAVLRCDRNGDGHVICRDDSGKRYHGFETARGDIIIRDENGHALDGAAYSGGRLTLRGRDDEAARRHCYSDSSGRLTCR